MASTSKSTEEEHREVYDPPTFKSVPGKDELKQLYKNYLISNGDEEYKVRTVVTDKLMTRYGLNGKYKPMNNRNIFCYSTWSVALEIENLMKGILAEAGKCANNIKDMSAGVVVYDNGIEYCVYLVQLRDNLTNCPFRGCYEVLEYDAMKAHIKSHEFLVDMEKLKLKAHSLGATIKIHTDPIPHFYRKWGSNSCEFCGEELIGMNTKNYHRNKCILNPQPLYPCLQDNCDHRSLRAVDFYKHHEAHMNKNYLETRNFKYKCDFCPMSYNDRSTRLRHQKI